MDVGAPSSTGLPGAGGRRGVSLRPVDRGRSGHRRRSRDGCGELAKLEMHPAIELLALLARVVAQRSLRAHRHHLDRRLRDAEVDEEARHDLSPALGQTPAVLGRRLAVGVALAEDIPSDAVVVRLHCLVAAWFCVYDKLS